MGWLRLVCSLKSQDSNAKEPNKRDYILQKRPIISRSLLIFATPYHVLCPCISLCPLPLYISLYQNHDPKRVCIYIYIYVYVHVYIYIFIYLHIYISIYPSMSLGPQPLCLSTLSAASCFLCLWQRDRGPRHVEVYIDIWILRFGFKPCPLHRVFFVVGKETEDEEMQRCI